MISDMIPSRRGRNARAPHSVSGHAPNRALPHRASNPFRTPEAVANNEEQAAETATAGKLLPEQKPQKPKKKHSFVAWLYGLSTAKKVLWISVIVVLLAGLAVGAYFMFFKKDAPVAKPVVVHHEETPPPPPAPTTVASNLTGLQVDPSFNDRPVTAVMIENSADARPQSGLSQAGVVFEAVAEGGITRFCALFQDTTPDFIEPVRSVRPYYISWAMGFDAAIAHAGGSAEALNDMKSWNVKDLNHSAKYFHRDDSRPAPHNLYTSIAELNSYEKDKGYGKANFTGFARKEDAPSTSPTAKQIDLAVSTGIFKVHYGYDPLTNSYKRFEGGAAHMDKKSGTQLLPKVVVALVVPKGKNDIYTTYKTIGTGTVFVFQDGIVTEGTWHKESNSGPLTFTDKSGAPLKLNAGQTWVTALGSTSEMSYAP